MKKGIVLVEGRRGRRLFLKIFPSTPWRQRGIVLVEVLLAAALLAVILVPTLNFFVTGIESSWFASREPRAQALVRESLEALRSVRERNWMELADGTYYPVISGGIWQLILSPEGEAIGPFTRKIEVLPVYRSETGGMVEEGGRLDPSTKKANLSVSWHSLRDRTLIMTTYLTRYLDNLIWTQTLKAEFDQGEKDLTDTIEPPLNDGEIELVGGCVAGNPESLIYDDELRNGWRVNCDGLPFWQKLFCWLVQWLFQNNAELDIASTDYTWNNSPYSMKMTLKPTGWSWIRLWNYGAVCTKGFKNLHFYAYNPTDQEETFYLTAVYEQWETAEIVLPSKEWTEISVDYDTLEEYEDDLSSLYFHKQVGSGDPDIVFYVDQLELTGGIGGYFTKGTLASSVLDAGRETAFNRISYHADMPIQTSIGFQIATSNNSNGPWLFYGPGGTTDESDLYVSPEGEGIWLGNNLGQYLRYKAYLFSDDGAGTPVLNEVTVNYAP